MITRLFPSLAGMLLIGIMLPGSAFCQVRNPVTELIEARRIYVPLEDLDVVMERDKQGVILARDKFNELLAQAKANLEKNPQPSGGPVAVTAADYAARIAGDQLLISVTAELTQFEGDWAETRFGLQRLALEQALLDDSPALLGRNADGSVSLFTAVRGKHMLKLQLSTDLNALGSDQIAAFSLLRAPTGTLTLTLPAGKRLLVGNLQLERPTPLEQAANYRVAVGGAGGIQLRITDRATENAADSLMFATTGYGLNVAPGEVTWHALTTLQVFGKPVDRLTFSVPRSLEIADVDATGLEAWNLSDDAAAPERTTISLTFGQAFEGNRKIAFKGVMATPTGKPWAVPPLKMAGVTSHIGQVVVQHSAGVRLRVEETTGLRRAAQEQKSAADMPDDLAKFNATEFMRFDIWQPDFILRVTTQPKQREVQAAVAAVLDVNVTGLELQAAVTVETHFAPLFEIDIRLPSEWQVQSVLKNDQPLKWQIVKLDEVGINQLRVLLDTPLAADAQDQIRLALRRDVEGWPVEAQPVVVDLPELYLPQSSISEGAFVVRGDDELDLESFELKGLDPQPLKADFERLRFQTQDTRYAGKIRITRKSSRVAVQTITFGRIDPQTFHTFVQSVVEVQGGGIRSIKVALPEATGTAIRFESPGLSIVEQKAAAPANGERIWTLQFGQRLRGQALILCDIELPRGEAAEFVVPQCRFIDAERQNGYFAVEAGGEQRLTVSAKGTDGQDLTEVDLLDLPNVYYQPKERIVTVHRSPVPGAVLTLSEQKFDKLPVPTAICPLLQVSTILGRTGELQHRATFHLDVVGVQGLHVTFPTKSTLWATIVDDRPVEVRRNGDVYLIPLAEKLIDPQRVAQNPAGEGKSHVVNLFYRSEIPAVSRFGTLSQTPPSLTVESGQRTALPVEVLEQKWDLHYPQETRLVNSRSPLEPQQPLDNTSCLGSWISSWKGTATEHLGWKLLAVAVTIGAISLLTYGFRQKQISVALVVVVVICAGMAFTMMLPAVQQAREASIRTQAKNELKQRELAEQEARIQGNAKEIQLESRSDIDRKGGTDVTLTLPGKASNLKSHTVRNRTNMTTPEQQPKVPGLELNESLTHSIPAPSKTSKDHQLRLNENLGKKRAPAAGFALNQPIPDEEQPAPEQNRPGDLGEDAQDFVEKSRGLFDGKKTVQLFQGLLSLAIDFVPPAGSREMTFHYVGADTSPSGIPLQVDYVDQQAGATTRLFLIALVAMIAWFLRNQSATNKAALATLGIVVPLALAPLAPISWQIMLDGTLFGTFAAVGVWLAHGCALHCPCCCPCISTAKKNAIATLLVMLLSLPGTIFAAENDKTPAEKPAIEPKPIPTVVIPFDAGTEPLASNRVFLSHEQFLELYRLAKPDQVSKPSAPQAGGIFEAFYAASLVLNSANPDESVVRVAARYAVRSFVDGQLIVELPIGQVSAAGAKLDGQSAPLIAAAGRFRVAVKNPGLHVIDFSFDVPTRLSGSTGSFLLPLLPVHAGKLTFQLPAKDLAIRINGSSTLFRRETQGESQTLELPIDKGGDVTIAWQPQQSKGAATAVVHVDSVTALTLTDAGGAVSHGFAFRVRQGGIADTSFILPETLRLQSISGPDVGGWEVQGEGAARTLRVIFRRNITDETRLTIETFLDVTIGTTATLIALPQVAPKEITNEIGQVIVFAGNQFSIRAAQVDSLSQIDADKFTTQIPVSRPNVAPQLAYRFSKRPFTLSLQATRQESQAHVTSQQAAIVTLRKQQTTTRLRYNLLGAPRSSLAVVLPAKFVLLDVQATGLRDWYVAKQEDGSQLTIELNGPKLGMLEVVLGGFTPRDNDAVSIKFPQPLEATRIDSTAAVWLDEGFTATLESFDGWQSVDASQASDELRAVRPQLPPHFVFASTNISPSAIALFLKQATPKLSANGLSMVTVTDVAVIYTLALQWQIDAAKTDVLTLTTPKWLAGKLEFQGSGLREATHVEVGGDRTRWTLHLRTPASGKYFATAVATLPPAATEVLAPAIVFEQEQKPLDSQKQFVLLINSSLSQLTAVDPSLTEPVQREDVPVVIQKEFVDQATELVRVKSLLSDTKWSLNRFSQQPGAPASVNVADLTTVLSRDGTYRAEAVYTIKNRSRQFLALRMPEGTELLSVFVAGQPSRAVAAKLPSLNGATAQLIALPKTSAASLSFPVKLVWRGRLNAPLPTTVQLSREEFAVPAPKILSQQDDGEYGIPVARTRWTVYLPEDLDAEAVRSTTKHNLSLSQNSDSLYGEATLQEAIELMGYLEQTLETNRRSQSRSSLGQIGVATRNLKRLGQDLEKAGNTGDAQFASKKADVLRKLSELEKLAEDDSQKSTVLSRDRSSVLSGERKPAFQSTGIDEGQSIARDQQSVFFTNNSNNGLAVETQTADSQFRFNLELKDESEGLSLNSTNDKSKVNRRGKAAIQGIETRQQLQISNTATINELNGLVTNNNSLRQNQFGMGNLFVNNGGVDGNTNSVYGQQTDSNIWGGKYGFSLQPTAPSLSFQYQLQGNDPFGRGGGMGGGAIVAPSATPGIVVGVPAADMLFDGQVVQDEPVGLHLQMAQQPQRPGQNAAPRGATLPQTRNRPGGLSLGIDLPATGRKLVFTKTGGDPKLTLAIRSHESVRYGISLVWSAIWIVIGAAILKTIRKVSGLRQLLNLLPIAAIVVGILGFCVFSAPSNAWGFVLFLVGSITAAWQYGHAPTVEQKTNC